MPQIHRKSANLRKKIKRTFLKFYIAAKRCH